MPVTCRVFTPADLDWASGLLVAWDDALPQDTWRHMISGEGAPVLAGRVLEDEGGRLGFGMVVAPEGLPYPIMSVLIDPRHRGHGHGSRLIRELELHRPPGDVGAGMRDDDPGSRAIAEHWGFTILGHGIDSVLDLAEQATDVPAPEGIRVVVLPGTDVVDSGHDVDGFLASVGDFPEVDIYGTTVTNASLLQALPDFDWVLLVDDAGIAAASSVAPHSSGQWLIVFSGTAPRARGRGLARAAKEQAHAYARRAGATSVRTTNEERNERIRALNESLGYRRAAGELRLVRRG